nr:immunoglobulin heavy chain junction region [Macaca mulatta]
CARDQSNYDSW